MLSNETRPVEMIATDERGCPRWVMCHWRDGKPEQMLLLNPRYRLSHGWSTLCYNPSTGDVVHVAADILHEMPTE